MVAKRGHSYQPISQVDAHFLSNQPCCATIELDFHQAYENFRFQFSRLKISNIGLVSDDANTKRFKDLVLEPRTGAKFTRINAMRGVLGGSVQESVSLYQSNPSRFCNPEIKHYFDDLIINTHLFFNVAIKISGQRTVQRLDIFKVILP